MKRIDIDKDKEREPTQFELNGITDNAEDIDIRTFKMISDTFSQFTDGKGHSYIPNKLEFRASSVAKCSRKILLQKVPKNYLSDEEILELQITEKILNKHDVKIAFGASIAGQLIHEALQEVLESKMHSMEEEVTYIINDVTLIGHYDLLVVDELTGDQIVIDIKTTSAKRMYLPNQSHLTQLMAYQGMLKGIRGAILYVNRNNFDFTYYPQEFSKEKFSEIIKKIVTLASAERNKKLPPPIPEYPEECANYSFKCEYYNYCFPEDIGFSIVEDE